MANLVDRHCLAVFLAATNAKFDLENQVRISTFWQTLVKSISEMSATLNIGFNNKKFFRDQKIYRKIKF